MASPYCDVKTVADRFLVSEETVRRWVRQGKIPHHNFNGVVRFKSSEIEEFERQARRAQEKK